MSFIEVEVSVWDCNKVTIGMAPKGKEPGVLYEGKIPIIKLCTSDARNKYICTSYKGLQRSMTFDKATNSFLDSWEGDWYVSFQIARSYALAKTEESLAWKIIKIFEDIEKKIEQAFEKKPNSSLGFSWIKEKNSFGIEKKVGIDDSKGVYIKSKVGYDSPKNAPTMPFKGKEVPVHESRFPKCKFYDITRAQQDMVIKNPDIECQTSMNAVPKMMISIAIVNDVIHVTKKLLQLYYEPTTIGGNAPDDDLISMLRDNLDLGNQ